MLFTKSLKLKDRKNYTHTDCIYNISRVNTKNFASLSKNGEIFLWNSKKRKIISKNVMKTKIKNCTICMTINEKLGLIAIGDNNDEISIFSYCFHKLKKIKSLIGHENVIRDTIFYPQEKLISCSNDQTIKVWDIKSGLCLESFQTDKYFNSLCFNNDKLLAATFKNLCIFDLAKSKKCNEILAHETVISKVIPFSENTIVTGGWDNLIKLWDLRIPKFSMNESAYAM